MKAISGYLLTAAVLALVGGVCLAAGIIDRDMARAQQSLAALNYDEPKATFETVEHYFEYGSRIPGFGAGPLNDVRARKAAVHYWQRRYDMVIPQNTTEPVDAIPADNHELQLIVANAVFRAGMAEATDRPTAVQAVNTGITAYLTVLKNAERQEEAAHNYEYLVRLRDELAKGRGPSQPQHSPHGQIGGVPSKSKSDFKIYVPLESKERQKSDEAGKSAPLKRKG